MTNQKLHKYSNAVIITATSVACNSILTTLWLHNKTHCSPQRSHEQPRPWRSVRTRSFGVWVLSLLRHFCVLLSHQLIFEAVHHLLSHIQVDFHFCVIVEGDTGTGWLHHFLFKLRWKVRIITQENQRQPWTWVHFNFKSYNFHNVQRTHKLINKNFTRMRLQSSQINSRGEAGTRLIEPAEARCCVLWCQVTPSGCIGCYCSDLSQMSPGWTNCVRQV